MVQLVHYPAFKYVGKENCFAFQQHHTRSISRLVIPLMLAELAFALWLLFWPMTFIAMEYLNYFSFACLLLIWLITFLKAVPYHRKLSKEGYESSLVKKLIRINWLRTIAWTLRLLAIIGLMHFFV